MQHHCHNAFIRRIRIRIIFIYLQNHAMQYT